MRYEAWTPIAIPDAATFLVDEIHDDDTGFRIVLSASTTDDERLEVVWAPPPLVYQVTNESHRLQLWEEFPGAPGHTFYVVRDSPMLGRFHEDTLGIHRGDSTIMHYAIYSLEDCVDVIAQGPPRVAWVPAR